MWNQDRLILCQNWYIREKAVSHLLNFWWENWGWAEGNTYLLFERNFLPPSQGWGQEHFGWLKLCCFTAVGVTLLYPVGLQHLVGAVGELLQVSIIFCSLVFATKLLVKTEITSCGTVGLQLQGAQLCGYSESKKAALLQGAQHCSTSVVKPLCIWCDHEQFR